MKYKTLIKEDTGTHDYGCAMIYFEFPGISAFQSVIDDDDVYHKEGDRSFGLETEPHTTLLYGLHSDVDPKEVMKVMEKYTYNHCRLYNVSTFNNSDYDVLKFDVESPVLHEVNQELKKFPHTTSFPIYHPHMTIAYLKPGMGEKYIKNLNWAKFMITPNKLVYSTPSGKKYIKEI